MKKYIVILIFALLSSISLFSKEAPQEIRQNGYDEPGYHEHDGLYMRYLTNFGFGYTYHNLEIDRKPREISDWVADESFQIGYAIDKNLILYGGFSSQIVPPLFTLIWLYWATNSSLAASDYYALTLTYSAGLTYYFMPKNVYVSVGLGLSQIGVKTREKFYETDLGYGLQVSIGKESWVSKNWGLGIALNVSYDFFPTTRAGYLTITPLHALMVGISFSATYN
jgi:hypothetical protein